MNNPEKARAQPIASGEGSHMNERRRIVGLALTMALVALVVGAIAVALPYQAAFEQTEARLTETAKSQARLMEAMARHEAKRSHLHPEGPSAATLSQIRDAHQQYEGLGETGEFTLARREGDQMVFLLSHRHFDRDLPRPVPFDSELAEPMRRSLSGQSGTVVGLDYRGELVLAAHEPVAGVDMGIVAKIDLAEIRAPFVKTTLIAALFGLMAIALGAVLYVRVSGRLVRNLEAETESRRKAEESLRQSLAFNESILSVSPDLIYLYDIIEQRNIYSNERISSLHGYTVEEIQEMGDRLLQTLMHPDDFRVYLSDILPRYGSARDGEIIDHEYRMRARDGEWRWLRSGEAIYKRLADGTAQQVIGITSDITGRKQAEQALLQSSRLIALGQMAAGMAHELNQPLTVISAMAEGLQIRLARGIEMSAERLKRWSGDVIQGVERMINLIHNARDAVEEKRELLPDSDRDDWQMRLDIRTFLEQDQVVLEVEDNGTGMDEATRLQVLEPFYTTKGPDRGTGLGLSISLAIVQDHGGEIGCVSQEGEGTVFRVRLPVAEAN